MTSARVLLARLVAMMRPRQLDATLDEEIQAHLARLGDDHRARGLSPQAAREAARRDFGGIEQIKELHRQQRRFPVVDTIIGDVRHALRTFRRAPGFVCLCVLILGLGIGANSAIFSLADAVLLRTLPFNDPERLVMAWELSPSSMRASVGQPTFLDWAEQATSFEAMAAIPVGGGGRTIPSADGIPQQVPAQSVSAQFFDVLRVRPVAGRTFVPSDAAPGRAACRAQ